MRAFLAVLLFALLPLQFSAAVAEACCGHVQAMPASQAMHHQPAHGLALASVDDPVSGSSSFDLDCGTCHTNCAAAVFGSSTTLADPAGIERVEHLAENFMPPWHARPYRPQWLTPFRSGWSTAA